MIDKPVVSFQVPGEPVQAISAGNIRYSKGRRTQDRQRNYMKMVGWIAKSAMSNTPIITGAVRLCAVFSVKRPKVHYDSKGRIKAQFVDAPHLVYPDLKNFVWLIEDAMSKIVYNDDSQIIEYPGTRKRYVSQDELPGVSIQVFEVK